MKYKSGEVIGEFSEFVNPERHIPEKGNRSNKYYR